MPATRRHLRSFHPLCQGLGFGHKHFVNNEQGYCWNGQASAPPVFEIAVKRAGVTLHRRANKVLNRTPKS